MKTQLYRNFVVLLGILVLLLGMPYLGQAAPPAQKPTLNKSDVYKKFVQDAGTEPDITWDEETGVPTFISGTFPSGLRAHGQTTPLEEAYTFFDNYGGLFRMQSSEDELFLLKPTSYKALSISNQTSRLLLLASWVTICVA